MLDRFLALQREEGGREQVLAPVDLSEPANALEYLQNVYKGRRPAELPKMRAAMAALPFEHPKLSAMAVASMSGKDFAAALDRAIARSARTKLMDTKALPQPE